MTDTIFAKMLNKEIAVDTLYEDEHCIVINDIHPQAPLHILIIPRQAIPRLVDATKDHQALLGHLLLVAKDMAKELGMGEGFRVVINNGKDGGQTVFHLHIHVLGKKSMDETDMNG